MGVCLINHLGLGDQIMVNGMVRHLAKKEDVAVIVTESQKETIEFMYRDIDNVKVLVTPTKQPQDIFEVYKSTGYDLMPLATYRIDEEMWKLLCHHDNESKLWSLNPLMTNWCEAVYNQAGVNIKYMRSDFKVVRDKEREEKLMKTYDLEPGKYIFVHDSDGRRLTIESDLKVFNADSTWNDFPNIFDYITVIENAKEVHCIHSSYAWMIEMLGVGSPEKNFFYNIKCQHPYHSVKCVFSDDIWTFKD